MYNQQMLSNSEKRERERKDQKKRAFDSVIDEVALFDFKHF